MCTVSGALPGQGREVMPFRSVAPKTEAICGISSACWAILCQPIRIMPFTATKPFRRLASRLRIDMAVAMAAAEEAAAMVVAAVVSPVFAPEAVMAVVASSIIKAARIRGRALSRVLCFKC